MKALFLSLMLVAPLCFGATPKKPDARDVKTRATCTGSDPCHACSGCHYCNHCAKQGGTCGVKKKAGG